MTKKKRNDELGAVLGNLRKERSDPKTALPPEEAEMVTSARIATSKGSESREAFTSRLRPSQRRWLKRWGSNVEEDLEQRVTLEDILEVLVSELQENESLQHRISTRLSEES